MLSWLLPHVSLARSTIKALGPAGAHVLETDLPVGRAHERIDADGELTDPEMRKRLAEIVADLVNHQHTLAAAA